MPVKITIADEQNARHISAIGLLSFYDAFASYFEQEEDLQKYLEYTYAVEKIRCSILKENNIFFIAWLDGQPVGFAKVKKFSLNSQITSVAQMELQKIYVLTEHHGTGAGPALIRAVIKLAQQMQPDILWLDVYFKNAKALHFYEKHGFKKYGKHYFNIGSQTFEYDLMTLPIHINETIPVTS